MISAKVMNKAYELMKDLTIEQLEEARDVHGHKMLEISPEAYRLYIYQCNYMIEKKRAKEQCTEP